MRIVGYLRTVLETPNVLFFQIIAIFKNMYFENMRNKNSLIYMFSLAPFCCLLDVQN
jgi:hypothetical protein